MVSPLREIEIVEQVQLSQLLPVSRVLGNSVRLAILQPCSDGYRTVPDYAQEAKFPSFIGSSAPLILCLSWLCSLYRARMQ